MLGRFMIYPMLKAALRSEAYNASLILIHVFLLGAICTFSARLFVSEAENFVQKMTRNCITAAAFFGLIVCIQAVLLSILKHFGIDPVSSADPDQGILFFFELLLYAPLCEEIVFRACLIDECAAHINRKVSVMFSCLLFGLLHVFIPLFGGSFTQIFFLPVYALSGYLLYECRKRTGSIICSTAVHCLVNGASLLL